MVLTLQNLILDNINMPDYIKKKRKKHARSIRKGLGNITKDGKTETHKMEWGDETKKGKKQYTIKPSITF